ncbi:MAG: hypothetical protein FWD31_05650 [Planctomycetaceae bacterium]|nr:hypothetical protein [Planctomycetaceae bacterium]
MTKILLLLIPIVLVCCLGCPFFKNKDFASDRGREKLSKENQVAVRERSQKVKAELAALHGHPWAGTYHIIIHLGEHCTLDIAPDAGYAYTCFSSDQVDENGNLLCDQNYGSVTWENGYLKFSHTLASDGNDFASSTEFIPIAWEKRLYLVPANKVIDFCNAVNARYPLFAFLLRNDFKTKPDTGVPEVPEEFKPYLLDDPVEGEITAVGETREFLKISAQVKETLVTISKGSQDGILPGMTFWVTKPDKIFYPITLTEVAEMESVGIIEQPITETTPQVGWSISTRYNCPMTIPPSQDEDVNTL